MFLCLIINIEIVFLQYKHVDNKLNHEKAYKHQISSRNAAFYGTNIEVMFYLLSSLS